MTCGEPVTYSGKQQIGHKEQAGESLLPENISLPFCRSVYPKQLPVDLQR